MGKYSIKGKSKKIITSIASVMALVVIGASLNIGNISKADEYDEKGLSVSRDMDISLDSSGNLVINRSEIKNQSMGKEDTWTLFIYMTGSDLESGYQNASKDLKEIMDAVGNNENVNIIVQTGGSGKWHTDGIDAKSLGRYKIAAGQLEKLDEVELASMGKSDTLYNFLEWGVTNYPAEHMGVVFWNHGSGISKGLCIDTIYNDDALSLGEVEYALAKLNDRVLTDQFELIGFDTCLSGSLEYANMLATYARYMVASADVEPNDGWYYTDFIEYIYENSDASGKKVGQAIVDSYRDYYAQGNKGEYVTLATYDLSQVDKVCYEINKFAKYLDEDYKANKDESKIIDLMGSVKIYTYGNMDIGSLVNSLNKSGNYDASSIEKALDKLVIYKSIGSGYDKNGCNGITIFSPLSNVSMSDFNVSRNALVSPYWLNILEATTYYAMQREVKIYGKTLSYTTNEWENSKYYYEDTFDYIKYENHLLKDTDTYKLLKTNSEYEFASKWNSLFKAYNEAIKMPEPSPSFGGGFNMGTDFMRGKVSAKLEDTTNVKDVYSALLVEEQDSITYLGEQANVSYNKETGEINADVIKDWFALPDGQLLTTYVIEQIDNSVIYGFPVVIDDVESTIRIKETKINGKVEYELLGVWDATDNSNYAPRGYLPLKIGTIVTPIYEVYNKELGQYEVEYGQEYEIVSEFDFVLVDVGGENEECYMAFKLDRILGKDMILRCDIK